MSNQNITIEGLFESLKKKIATNENGSYTAELANGGVEKITRKVGEEAIEVVIAAFLNDQQKSDKTREELVGEICDLIFHSLVLTAQQKIDFSEISAELTRRNNLKK